MENALPVITPIIISRKSRFCPNQALYYFLPLSVITSCTDLSAWHGISERMRNNSLLMKYWFLPRVIFSKIPASVSLFKYEVAVLRLIFNKRCKCRILVYGKRYIIRCIEQMLLIVSSSPFLIKSNQIPLKEPLHNCIPPWLVLKTVHAEKLPIDTVHHSW